MLHAVDVLCSQTDDVSSGVVASATVESNLVLVAQIRVGDSRSDRPKIVTRGHWAGTPPVLAISEEPAVPAPKLQASTTCGSRSGWMYSMNALWSSSQKAP